eukprot:TRINITY_DN2909_c0_g1_i2.p1 TRINITY_DN2909_c0_g1~~TRINITY_DN2909_c0_g1_i2.p1  ORF type:complete len:369 (+),score=76.11 TRINITY_DN2909_c0_g1_i2:3-1109(+)
MPDFRNVPAKQLELYMQRLFKIGDKDGNGVLDVHEFRNLLLKSGFQLDDETIQRIMLAADTNNDGVIQYAEFVPAMRSLISSIPRSDGPVAPSTSMPDASQVDATELRSYLQRLFKIGDRDGNGVLSPHEFESLLRKSGFKFDNVTIRRIMNAVDTNHDGVIQYDEFVPAIISLLRHQRAAPAPAAPAPSSSMPDFYSVPSEQLELYMHKLFKIGDKDGNGVLDAVEFRDLLEKSGFQLNNSTINKIMVAADKNRDGVIQYAEFVPAMKVLIENLPRPGQYQRPAPQAPASAPVRPVYSEPVYGQPVHSQPARSEPVPPTVHARAFEPMYPNPRMGYHHSWAPHHSYRHHPMHGHRMHTPRGRRSWML